MSSFPQEFLVLCRQLGEAQQRCSAALAAQAAEIQALQAEVVRLRGAVVLRDTRLALAQDELTQLQAMAPGLWRRRAVARHISALVDRIAALSRECLRWRLAAGGQARVEGGAPLQGEERATYAGPGSDVAVGASRTVRPVAVAVAKDRAADAAFDTSLAAANLVICQTGCISHDDYWRVQDHCRRTGKPCILIDPPLAASVAASNLPLTASVMHFYEENDR